jgi:hypothetical protein
MRRNGIRGRWFARRTNGFALENRNCARSFRSFSRHRRFDQALGATLMGALTGTRGTAEPAGHSLRQGATAKNEVSRTRAEMETEADAIRISTLARRLSREIGDEIYVLTTVTLIEVGEAS